GWRDPHPASGGCERKSGSAPRHNRQWRVRYSGAASQRGHRSPSGPSRQGASQDRPRIAIRTHARQTDVCIQGAPEIDRGELVDPYRGAMTTPSNHAVTRSETSTSPPRRVLVTGDAGDSGTAKTAGELGMARPRLQSVVWIGLLLAAI